MESRHHLKGTRNRTPEERRQWASKGGRASAAKNMIQPIWAVSQGVSTKQGLSSANTSQRLVLGGKKTLPYKQVVAGSSPATPTISSKSEVSKLTPPDTPVLTPPDTPLTGMENSGWVPLSEACQRLGKGRTTLLNWLKAGKLEGYQKDINGTPTWLVRLDAETPKPEPSPARLKQWEEDLAAWEACQATSFPTRKGMRPLSPKTIEANRLGMQNFLRFAELTPPVNSITPAMVMKALQAVPPGHDSVRANLYKAVISFTKWQIMQGQATEAQLLALRPCKPTASSTPARKLVNGDELDALLLENQTYRVCRSDYDVVLMQTILLLMGKCGLRRDEVCNLKAYNVDFKNNRIRVKGKGAKERWVAIPSSIKHALQAYHALRPLRQAEHWVQQATGEPFKGNAIYLRVKRLAKRIGLDVSPHSFRRLFATWALENGVVPTRLQRLMGHASFATTQNYVHHEDQAMLEDMARL